MNRAKDGHSAKFLIIRRTYTCLLYKVDIIDIETAGRIYSQCKDNRFLTSKADISGICIKIHSEDRSVIDMWRDNFYPMLDEVRTHARIFCLKDDSGELKVLYNRTTSTVFLYNFDYYGCLKSIALAMASDILEDSHKIYSVHGAALDIDGIGITLIAPSKTGKTTQSWGLLRAPNSHLITDDWYFVRLYRGRPLIGRSEMNCYIDADIGDVWEEFKPLVETTKFDNKGRGIANVRWITGKESVTNSTYMRYVIFLKRDPSDPVLSKELTLDEAMEYIVSNDFCNPHQMIRDERKMRVRSEFFRSYLSKCKVFLINTTKKAEETQELIRKVIGI